MKDFRGFCFKKGLKPWPESGHDCLVVFEVHLTVDSYARWSPGHTHKYECLPEVDYVDRIRIVPETLRERVCVCVRERERVSVCACVRERQTRQVSRPHDRFRARRGQRKMFQGLFPESQGQNLALAVLHVPHSLASGLPQ